MSLSRTQQMHHQILGVVFFLLLELGSASKDQLGSCPGICECSRSAGVTRVDCSNLNLTTVPSDIPPDTGVLDLSWNSFQVLPEDSFLNVSNLQDLNLANNLLERIPDSALSKLTRLKTLHLQNNKIQNNIENSLEFLVLLQNLYLSYNDFSHVSESVLISSTSILKLAIDKCSLSELPRLNAPKLEILNSASNNIRSIPDFTFKNLKTLLNLYLQHNQIEFVGPKALEGLVSLKVLTMNGNRLLEIPPALASVPHLKELSLSDNRIRFLPDSSFASNNNLSLLELSGNPVESLHKSAFAALPHLKKLTLSEVRQLEEFPDLKGTSSLEHLRIDRASLYAVPEDLCDTTPLLKSLNLKSNRITDMPVFSMCKELRLIDLSYNEITVIEDYTFFHQNKLIDLFLGHNSIKKISKNSFHGLGSLQVLDLESNKVESIDDDAFKPFKDLRDLNLGKNTFSNLPTNGLQHLRQLKTHGNRALRDFPSPSAFPRVHSLALSYAYHCCSFLAGRTPQTSAPAHNVHESVVWLTKDEVDMAAWNPHNASDIWGGTGNFSSKLDELANQLWKNLGRDYAIPDNLAQYAEEYFEDYKSALLGGIPDDFPNFPLHCIPEPGPFTPCEDLFGWWSLRCGVWLVFLLALLGNGAVVLVLSIGRAKMDVPRFLVANLAAADLMMSIYLGALAIVDASTLGEFKASAVRWQTSWGCATAGFLAVFSSELSVFTLSVITLERNYAITHAMHLNKRLSLRHAAYVMLAGWTFAGSMAALPLFGVSDYRKFAICLPFETEDGWSLSYVVFLVLVNGLAFLVLMGCYLRMYCAIRGSQAWNSNDSRIARRMALLVATDFLCWAPIAFFSLTAVAGLQLVSLEEAKVFAIFVLPLNSCANPFLYAISTKQFKRDCVHICKRIEESRITRGIGRQRQSSNFSNRHTPISATTNSAAPRREMCQCSRRTESRPQESWRELAMRYLKVCGGGKRATGTDQSDGYARAIANIQRNLERKRTRHAASISSENFSSRSDSWRQSNIPLRPIDNRRNSWQRKASDDSNLSCSRQDSSTTTFHLSRSSFSSDSSGQPRPGKPPGAIEMGKQNKPKLCRQGAVSEQIFNKGSFKEKNLEGLCPVCAKKEGTKTKELEEKFACFYNRMVENSCNDTTDTCSSKDEASVSVALEPTKKTNLESQKPELKHLEVLIKDEVTQHLTLCPHIEVNPMYETSNPEVATPKKRNSLTLDSSKINEEGRSRSLSDMNAKMLGGVVETGGICIPLTILSNENKVIDIPNLEGHLYNIQEISKTRLKDNESGKCKSMSYINTNKDNMVDQTQTYVTNISLGSLPMGTNTHNPSHDSSKVLKESCEETCNVLRSSKSENVVLEFIAGQCADLSATIVPKESKESFRTEKGQNGFPWNTATGKQGIPKPFNSSPNIRVENSEFSPLISNSDN